MGEVVSAKTDCTILLYLEEDLTMRRELSWHAMRTCFRSLLLSSVLSSVLIVPLGATALAQDTEPKKAKVVADDTSKEKEDEKDDKFEIGRAHV